MDNVTVVKLGGSAITDKSRKCTPDLHVIQHVADQLADYKGRLLVIHGGGSYAHPFAKAGGLSRGLRSGSQLRSISETEFYLGQLTRILCASLLLRKRFPVPLHPLSFAILNNGRIGKIFIDPIACSIRAGLTPLTHGDLVFDRSRGIGIVSGDRLAFLFGVRLKAPRVLLGCDVDGVYSGDPKSGRRSTLIREVTSENFRDVLRSSRSLSSDATGGMNEKVRYALSLARSGCESYIFNLKEKNALRKLFAGDEQIGTRFVPWKKARKSEPRQSQRA